MFGTKIEEVEWGETEICEELVFKFCKVSLFYWFCRICEGNFEGLSKI